MHRIYSSYFKTHDRYFFQGQEMDDEVKGEGNSYDFGARMLDPRLGRWLSIDPKAAKFVSESPYIFVGNNPIIFIDPSGEEKIIVIGGGDKEGKDLMKFINSGLLKLSSLIKKDSKETITLIITDIYLQKAHKESIQKTVNNLSSKYKGNINIIYINNGDELTNYLNSKSTKSEKIEKARKDDLITEVDFYGHGYRPDFSSQGPNQGSFEPAHNDRTGNEQMTSPENRPLHEKWAWGKEDVDKLNPNAFANKSYIDFSGICNASTPNEQEVVNGTNYTNLAKYTANKISGSIVVGLFGRSNYATIYDPKSSSVIGNPYSKNNGVGVAKSLPKEGSKYNDGSKSERIIYYGKKR
jgi:RHS repeat-associated protein